MTIPLSVLIVEDMPIIALDIEAELTARGWAVCGVCARAEEALAAIEAGPPSAAVLDVHLGDHASFEVARALRARGAAVVFLTGETALEAPDDLAALPWLLKPVRHDALDAALRAALGV